MASNLSNVTKAASIPQFAQGGSYNSGSLTYTVTATNTGTSTIAAGNFVMTDRASVATNFLSAQPTVIMLNNQILPTSSYTYGMTDSNTLYVQLNVPVNPNDTVTVFFGGQPSATLAVGSTLNNTATVTDRAGGTSGSASMSLPVVANVNSSVTNLLKTANQTLVPPGGTVIYTITGTYTGASTSGPLQIMDYLFNDNTNQGLLVPGMVPSETVTATVNNVARSISSGLSGSPTYNANLSTNMLLQGPLNNGDQFVITYSVTMPTDIPIGTGVENWIYTSLNGVAKGTFTNNRIVIGYPVITLSNVSKSVSPTTASPGGKLTYNVTATNSGNGATNPFTIVDTLPPGATLIPNAYNATINGASVAAPTVSQNGQTITFTYNSQVPAGSSANLIYQVQLPSDIAVGTTLTNNATVTGSTTDTGHQVSATAVVGSSQLTAHKSSFPASVIPGATITYTISVNNDSSAASTTAPWTIAETLPDNFNLIPNSIIASVTGNSMSAVTITPNPTAPNYLITLPQALQPGQTVNVAFNGTVADTAPPGSSFPNTASIQDGPTVSDANPPRIPPPVLSSAKTGTLNMPVSGQGGTITWTVTVTNTGSGAAPLINFIDPLGNGQTFVSGSSTATVNETAVAVQEGGTPTQPTFTLNTPLQPGNSATITFTTNLPNSPSPLTPGTQITNSGTVTAYPGDSGNAVTPSQPVVVPSADFTGALKTSCCGQIAPGDTVWYTITATNNGSLSSNPFIVTDPLPNMTDANGNNVPLVTYTGGTPTATVSNMETVGVTVGGTAQTPVFTVTQPVKPGQTVTLTFPCIVNPNVPLGTNITNTAFVQASPLGASTSTNPATFITEQTSFGNTTKIASSAVVVPGSSLGYVLTTSNNGNVTTSSFTMQDTLDPNLTFDPNTPLTVSVGGALIPASAYTVTQSGQNLTVTITDPTYQLSPGEQAQITYNTLVSSQATPGAAIDNSAMFSADANGDDPSHTHSTPVTVGAPNFSGATKSVTTSIVQPGQTFNYWINATNTGNAPSSIFTVTDAIPAGLTLSSATATATINGHTVPVTVSGPLDDPTFTINTPINPSDNVILSFPVTVNNDVAFGSTIDNVATIKGYPSDPGISTTTAAVTIGTPSFSPVSKVPSQTAIAPGGQFSYTVTATNNGTAPDPIPINMGDPLPTGEVLLSDPAPTATVNGQPTQVVVSGTNTNPLFSLQDSLAPGETATLTFYVTADPNSTNGESFNNTITVSSPEVTPTQATSVPVTIQTPVWNAVKLPSTQAISPGETLTYHLTGTNSGSATDNPFTVTDTLPAGMVLATPSNLTASINGQTVPVTVTGSNQLTFTVNGAVGHNQTFDLKFDVSDVNRADTGNVVTNTATINSQAGQPGITVSGPPVSIGHPSFTGSTKTALDANGNPITTASPGASILYKGQGTNVGDGVAVGPFKVTDTLPPGITWDSSYTPTVQIQTADGQTMEVPVTVTPTQDTDDIQTLTFNFPADAPIPVGATATLYFRVNTDSNLPVGTVIPNTMTGYAFASDPGTTTNVSNVTVAMPNFSEQASKSASPTSVYPGQTITYHLTATNTGQGAAPQFSVADTLPTVNIPAAGVTTPIFYNPKNVPTATLNGNPVSVAITGTSLSPIFTLVDVNGTPLSIPPGATVTMDYLTVVPIDASPATLINTATITAYPSDTGTTVSDSGVTLNPHINTNDTVQKTSASADHPGFEEIFPGEPIDYALNWTANNNAPSITLTDHLPPYTYLPDGNAVNLMLIAPDGTTTTTTLQNTGTQNNLILTIPGPILQGTQIAISFQAATDSNIPLNNYLINTAEINDGTDLNFVTDGPSGILVANPTFEIAKSASPTIVQPGDPLTYTITVTNTGTLSSNQFTIFDTLPSGISQSDIQTVSGLLTRASNNSTTATNIAISSSDTGGTIFTPADQLLPGDALTITYTVTVPNTLTAGTNLINSIHSKGYPSAIGEDTTDEPGVTVGASNLDGTTITKSVNPGFTPPGGQVNYSFNITTTTAINTSLTLTDTLPNLVTVPDNTNATYTINGVATQISNIGTDSNPIFTIPGPIPANSNILVQFNALLALDAPAGQNFLNTGTLSNGGGDQLTASDTPGFESRYVYDAQKTSLSDTVSPGEQITYQITATNVGDMTAPEFIVNDALPAGFNFTSADTVTATVGGVTVPVTTSNTATGTVTFSVITPVPAGNQVVLTYTATADQDIPIGSTATNTATIIAFPGDLGDTITDQGTTIQGNLQDANLTKSACPTYTYPGGSLCYTLTFQNQYAITTDLTLTDNLPQGMGFPKIFTATLSINDTTTHIPNNGTYNEPSFTIPAPIPANSTITLTFCPEISYCLCPGTTLSNTATLTDGNTTLTSNTVQTPVHQLYATAQGCQKTAFPHKNVPLIINYQQAQKQRNCNCCQNGNCQNRPIILKPCHTYRITYKLTLQSSKTQLAKPTMTLNNRPIPCSQSETCLLKGECTTLTKTFLLKTNDKRLALNMTHLSHDTLKFCNLQIEILLLD